MDIKLWLIVFTILLIAMIQAEKKMVCYHGSWSVYRQGNGKFEVQDMDPFLCTHLIYAFIGLNSDATIRIMDPWLEIPDNGGKNNFGQFNDLKKINPKLKTLAAIGGWNEGSAKFSKVANDPTLRSNFTKNSIAFIQKYGFDGLDINWEYPAQRDSENGSNDKNAYISLLQEMRKEFHKIGLLLTAAVAAAETSARLSYSVTEMSKHLDFINVMTYDFHGSWDGVTGHNSPLYPYSSINIPIPDKLNVLSAIGYWLLAGAPAEKIILGLPLYGRTFTLANSNQNWPGAPSTGPGIAGQYTLENGMIAYNELYEKMKKENWTEHWDIQASVPYTFKMKDWISYDDGKSLRAKVQFALKYNLGGVMVWSVEMDDFKNVCGNGSFAMLKIINSELNSNNESNTTSTSTTTTTASPKTSNPNRDTCTKIGFMRSTYDCAKFYYCYQMTNGTLIPYSFNCPIGTYFDTRINVCNILYLVDCKI